MNIFIFSFLVPSFSHIFLSLFLFPLPFFFFFFTSIHPLLSSLPNSLFLPALLILSFYFSHSSSYISPFIQIIIFLLLFPHILLFLFSFLFLFILITPFSLFPPFIYPIFLFFPIFSSSSSPLFFNYDIFPFSIYPSSSSLPPLFIYFIFLLLLHVSLFPFLISFLSSPHCSTFPFSPFSFLALLSIQSFPFYHIFHSLSIPFPLLYLAFPLYPNISSSPSLSPWFDIFHIIAISSCSHLSILFALFFYISNIIYPPFSLIPRFFFFPSLFLSSLSPYSPLPLLLSISLSPYLPLPFPFPLFFYLSHLSPILSYFSSFFPILSFPIFPSSSSPFLPHFPPAFSVEFPAK